MTKTLILSAFMLSFALTVSAQFNSGMTFGSGKGFLYDVKTTQDSINSDYKFNASIGYKFRIQPASKPFFYDIDLNIGYKKYSYYSYKYEFSPYSLTNHLMENTKNNYYVSLNPAFNYKLTRGLNAGIGLEPTLYYTESSLEHYHFDIPLTARVAYNFKFIEIGVGCKFGLIDGVLDSKTFSSGKLGDWQVQLFIPF